MNVDLTTFSTGLPGLDKMLLGLRAGDNVVWQVDSIEDYVPFVRPYWEECLRQQRKLVYFRFARHREIISPEDGGVVYRLRPEDSFEQFLTEILDIIEKQGVGACYVFDWLSDLAADWYSDRMLGNFFRIACPYLYDLKTIAYFGLRKDQHSFHATDGIFNTAQVVLEVHRKRDQLFLHPQKVFERYSPTLYMLHSWEGDEFKAVTNSAVITDILSHVPQPWMDFSIHRPGVWTRTFRQAQATWNAVRNGKKSAAEAEAFFKRVLKMVATRDERIGRLARKYFDLADLIEIMKRMIGTGLIGGKSLGMLLARAILLRSNPRWQELLEGHDSFFIGSDVFYTFLVENGCWWLRRRPKDFDEYLRQAEDARQRILQGSFPDYILDQFTEMLDYFGQFPIIVRSSSLLEDNYGNAFSGKYESVFCANQGSPQDRLKAFMNAVRTVYASTMSPEGLSYRRHHGLLDRDEQMALLVQRVSGEMRGHLFFPPLAGVGFSFNPFVWNENIDPHAGVLRLVFGLGTRAVERTDDDYTRLVALNAPDRRPDTRSEGAPEYGQRRVDVLDLQANELTNQSFESVAPSLPAQILGLLAEPQLDVRTNMPMSAGNDGYRGYLTFDRLLGETLFSRDMRELLEILQRAYDYPVDIEFTTNFFEDGHYRINLVQCRPFQVKIKGEGSRVKFPSGVHKDQILFESAGPIIGHSLSTAVERIIYVIPSVYSQMSMSQRYSVARLIGRITHLESDGPAPNLMLIGPGRWGTSMPSLGVPVSFAEINTVSVICEVGLMHEGLIPDISLGTHFFNDLVEMDMLYLAISPEKEGHRLRESLFTSEPNRLLQLLPTTSPAIAQAVWVRDAQPTVGNRVFLNVDAMKQKAICYEELRKPANPAHDAGEEPLKNSRDAGASIPNNHPMP
jgi:pyruvate, water dikinase